jgi:hypothetical protein
LGESLLDPQEKSIHGTEADSSHSSCLPRRQVATETRYNAPKTHSVNRRVFLVPFSAVHFKSIYPLFKVVLPKPQAIIVQS